MKGERRHELEKNDLADRLAKTVKAIQPYQNAILGIVLLGAIGVGAFSWWSRQSSQEAGEAWNEFNTALLSRSPGEFEDLAKNYPGTPLANYAAVMAGDFRLAMGCDQRFASRANANLELGDAEENYRTALKKTKNPQLRQRAMFGLARTLEAQGSLDDAIEQYQGLVDEWPEGTYSTVAAARAEDLQRPATRKWYDDFAKFDPKPSVLEGPGIPGQRLEFDIDSLPDDAPVFDMPLMDLEEKGAEEEPLPQPEPEEETTETPPAEE